MIRNVLQTQERVVELVKDALENRIPEEEVVVTKGKNNVYDIAFSNGFRFRGTLVNGNINGNITIPNKREPIPIPLINKAHICWCGGVFTQAGEDDVIMHDYRHAAIKPGTTLQARIPRKSPRPGHVWDVQTESKLKRLGKKLQQSEPQPVVFKRISDRSVFKEGNWRQIKGRSNAYGTPIPKRGKIYVWVSYQNSMSLANEHEEEIEIPLDWIPVLEDEENGLYRS